jgi:hypothetical protein
MDKTYIQEIEEKIKSVEAEINRVLNEIQIKQQRIGVLRKYLDTLMNIMEFEKTLKTEDKQLLMEIKGNGSLKKNEPQKTTADYAEEILESYNKEMDLKELYIALTERGKKLGGKNPRNTLFGILNNYRREHKRFYRINGKWGLLKWKEDEKVT